MKKLSLIVVILLMVSQVGCQKTASPEEVVRAWEGAMNAGDIDTALSYMTDDATIQLIPPPMEGHDGVFKGKEALRGWYERLKSLNGKGTVLNLEFTGDQATALLRYSDDELRALGIESIDNDWLVKFKGGKIESYTATMTEASLANLGNVMNAMALESFGDTWDLVILSDSSLIGVGKQYAAYIEEDMNVKVNLHDLWTGGLSAKRLLSKLQTLEQYREIVKAAEVVVFWGNPEGSDTGNWNCISSIYYVDDCSPETFAGFRDTLDAIIQEIFVLREGQPTIIRMTDFYSPLLSEWQAAGVTDACIGCFLTMNDAVHQVAMKHSIPAVGVFEAFSGSDGMEDPREKGYIGPDGIHTSKLGQQVIAGLLRDLGYVPVFPDESLASQD